MSTKLLAVLFVAFGVLAGCNEGTTTNTDPAANPEPVQPVQPAPTE